MNVWPSWPIWVEIMWVHAQTPELLVLLPPLPLLPVQTCSADVITGVDQSGMGLIITADVITGVDQSGMGLMSSLLMSSLVLTRAGWD